jgi:hypothetical protein
MGKASGVLLVTAGLGLAAYITLPANKVAVPSTDDFDLRLTQPLPGKPVPAPQPSTSISSSPAASADSGQTSASAPAVVSLSQYNRSSVRLPVGPQAKPGGVATDRSQLARELQRELRRLGCYEGEINGGWTTSTKRAMRAFTERVNASLPTEEPDVVLLSLVKGHPDRACGQPCPAGESAADGGRCIPTAVVSSQKKPPPPAASSRDAASPAIAGWSTTSGQGAAAAPPTDGRVGLAGPDGEDEQPASGALQAPPSGLTHQPTVSPAGYASQMREGRNATPIDRGPSRRFDAQSFFRRLDRQSAN